MVPKKGIFRVFEVISVGSFRDEKGGKIFSLFKVLFFERDPALTLPTGEVLFPFKRLQLRQCSRDNRPRSLTSLGK